MRTTRLGHCRRLTISAAYFFSVLLINLFVFHPAQIHAEPTAPSARDRRITLAVMELLRRDHISGRAVDDEIAQRMLQQFLDMLDPWKLYFYKSDVEQFRSRVSQLDDMLRRGDTSFAYEVFNRLLQRIDERIAVADQILGTPLDFSVPEETVRDRKLLDYPANELEAYDRWRKRIKHDLLLLKADGTEGQAAIDKLSRRYKSFAKRMHQTDDEELLEMYLTALTSSFDPHSSYMSPSTLENFEIVMRLELEGIGAALQSEDGYTVVKEIIPGGAAARDGRLKVGDRVIGVGQGQEGDIEDVLDMKLSDVVKRIRGPKGTVVRLKVVSSEGGEPRVVDILRDKIQLKDSEAQGQVFELGQKPDGMPYRIGVIDLPSFYMDMEGARRGLPDYKSTTRDVRRVLEQFSAQGVDAVVLDLRRNGGGALQEALALTGLFIEEGPLLQVKDANGRILPYYDRDGEMLWKGPLVVVISKFSASASEILAGAIQDYRRGLIVGDKTTHGKGTVQSLIDIGQQLVPFNPPRLGALKITMQQFYRPGGDSTQNRGVVAEVELPSITSHLDIAESDLDYALAFDRVPPLEVKPYNFVDPGLVAELARRSQARISQVPEFQRELETIARYLNRKNRKTISLKENEFLAEVKKLNADKREEELFRQMIDSDSVGIKRDYYLDEVLAVTLDYLNLRQVAQRF